MAADGQPGESYVIHRSPARDAFRRKPPSLHANNTVGIIVHTLIVHERCIESASIFVGVRAFRSHRPPHDLAAAVSERSNSTPA